MTKSTNNRCYRSRIYRQYVSAFIGHSPFDDRRLLFFDYLFKGILKASKPKAILEVACGQGQFLYWAIKRGFMLVRGFDVSKEQIEIARSLGLPAELSSYEAYLSEHDQSFDLIVGMDIIEHLTRDEALEFLELSFTALRPGGYLFLTTPNGSAFRPGPVVYADLTHETIFSPKTLSLALRLTGYKSIEIMEIAPPPLTLRSRVRRVLWYTLRVWPMLIDLIEKGSCSMSIYSRVMAAQARRPL